MKRLFKILKVIGIVLGCLVVLFLVAKLVIDKDLPKGEEGKKAEALAQKMLKAINHKAWKKTEAISWSFAGMHDLLWDKKRQLARIKWSDYTAFINCHNRTGYILKKGNRLTDPDKEKSLIERAYALWANDSYWLNPISKIYDDGVVREYVATEDGNGALKVTYRSGGVTPGDSYLWYVDEKGLPHRWEMWVKVIPFNGLGASWDGWQQSQTGVCYSSLHELGPISMSISDVEMSNNLLDLTNDVDPFTKLAKEF